MLSSKSSLLSRFSARSLFQMRGLRDLKYKTSKSSQEVLMTTEEEDGFTKDVVSKVNEQIDSESHGRLFATVHIVGKQKKVSEEDLITVQGYFPANPGEVIHLRKIMCVGSRDFTLYGRPTIPRDLVDVTAMVVERNLVSTRIGTRKSNTLLVQPIKFHKEYYSVLRIKKIAFKYNLSNIPDVSGADNKIF